MNSAYPWAAPYGKGGPLFREGGPPPACSDRMDDDVDSRAEALFRVSLSEQSVLLSFPCRGSAGRQRAMPAIFPGPLPLAIESSRKYSLTKLLSFTSDSPEPMSTHPRRKVRPTQYFISDGILSLEGINSEGTQSAVSACVVSGVFFVESGCADRRVRRGSKKKKKIIDFIKV